MGLDVTKPVFRVSDKGRLKPVFSVTETSKKIEIQFKSSIYIYDTFKKANNKCADQYELMHRLCCAFIVRKPEDRFSDLKAKLEITINLYILNCVITSI